MPRLARSLLRRAQAIDPLLPPLLQPCRDLASARNELRWLREHVEDRLRKAATPPVVRVSASRRVLRELCLQRSRGKPLQYILGTQPFGDLEILCRPKVLIPRPETEGYTAYLAQLLLESKKDNRCGLLRSQDQNQLRVLDLCTGTGCIALLLYSQLARSFKSLHVRGVDVSPDALALAHDNLWHNRKNSCLEQSALQDVNFVQGNVLLDDDCGGVSTQGPWDVIISNPPYISRTSFNRETTRSVRNYEPKLALVPPIQQNSITIDADRDDLTGDIFYDRIMQLGARAKARLLVMEVADDNQAKRVLRTASKDDYWQAFSGWPANLGSVAFVAPSQEELSRVH